MAQLNCSVVPLFDWRSFKVQNRYISTLEIFQLVVADWLWSLLHAGLGSPEPAVEFMGPKAESPAVRDGVGWGDAAPGTEMLTEQLKFFLTCYRHGLSGLAAKHFKLFFKKMALTIAPRLRWSQWWWRQDPGLKAPAVATLAQRLSTDKTGGLN